MGRIDVPSYSVVSRVFNVFKLSGNYMWIMKKLWRSCLESFDLTFLLKLGQKPFKFFQS